MSSREEWKNAMVGDVFTNEVFEKTGRFSHRTHTVYDIKLDEAGNGYACHDAEHAFIISELAKLVSKIDKLIAASRNSKKKN